MARQIGSGYKGIGKPIIQRDNWQAENHSAPVAEWFQRMTDLGILKSLIYKAELRGRPAAWGCFWRASFIGVLGIKWNHSAYSFKTQQKKVSSPPQTSSVLLKVILQMSAPYVTVRDTNVTDFQFSYLKTTMGNA